MASEIAKCGLNTQLLGLRETAVFLKYSFSRNFDEREIKDLKDEELLDWVKPKEIVFRANKYKIDGTEASVLAVSDYPLRVKNAWGAELFNIPNTKVVMHVKPVDKFKAIRRIDKCIGEMETKSIISDKASEANSAETHRATMDTLLDALQTENESLFDVTLTVTAYNYTNNDNYTNPLGHNYESTYMPATCTDYGKTVFTCQVCGSGYFETDGTYPTGHNYNNEFVAAPTCTTDGLRRSTCEICGDVFETKITANGHNYTITDSASTKGKTTRTYTCTVCHHSYTEELGDQYEEVSNYVEYLFKQYQQYMWWVLLASAGVWSIVIGVMIAIAHKNEDREKARKMLINYVIGLVVIAVIVVACPFLVRGIAALVT